MRDDIVTILITFALLFLLFVGHAILCGEARADTVCAGTECIVMPDAVDRSLDKVIVTRPDGSQDTYRGAPGSGTSYVYPREPETDYDFDPEEDTEESW